MSESDISLNRIYVRWKVTDGDPKGWDVYRHDGDVATIATGLTHRGAWKALMADRYLYRKSHPYAVETHCPMYCARGEWW